MGLPRKGAVRLAGRAALSLFAALTLLGAALTTSSMASTAAPHWSIVSESQPTYFNVGDASDAYVLIVRNDGAAATAGEVTLTDTLPAGVRSSKITAEGESADGDGLPAYVMTCGEETVGTVTCKYTESATKGPVLPGAVIVVTIAVSIPEGARGLAPNTATVSGGGAPSASMSETTPIDTGPVPFGLSFFDVDTAEENGDADMQAGSHPFELTASLAFTVAARELPSAANGEHESPLAGAAVKDLEVVLPPGLVGDPTAVPRCSQRAFLERERLNCPLDTQVGTLKPFFYGTFHSTVVPVYDVVPPPGQPAELGFSIGVGHVPLFLHVSVRANGEYALTGSLNDIPETGPLQGAILTLWGVPAASSHDLEREGTVGEGNLERDEFCTPSVEVSGGVEQQTRCPSGAPATPFLTLPSKCQSSPLAVGVAGDSWEDPALEPLSEEGALAAAITGCELLSFTPTLTLAPETTQAGAPSGYTLDVHTPQDEDPNALATPDVRSATVALPPGVALSPSVANGLQACSSEQFGPTSSQPGSALAAAECPPQSQIGTVRIATPLLASPLEGQVFIGDPGCAPCTPGDAEEGRLIRLLVQAQGSGVTIKLEGSASIDQATGQLTASFEKVPQLPFEDVQLTLDGGVNAPLVNSSTACGTPLWASSRLTPYSGETPAQPSSEPFTLRGCPAPQFHPSFVAGTTDNRAGAFSPLTVALSRSDEDEDLQAVEVRLAPGLLGLLSKVDLCQQAQARAGTCPPDSEIGTASVQAGPGAEPLPLEGSVYLTGPYEGAPFGLSIVVPAMAGPFDLGEIVVGARIYVNPETAALTIASDPLPQSVDGIPLQLKTLDLDIDREGFVFNPTDCRALAIEGALTSSAGASEEVSSRFQAADCASLPFKPKLTALTHAHANKAAGVHLHVRIATRPGEANLAKLKLTLPKRIVPRLSTLQKACRAAAFAANPASCPSASAVGTATVLSPVLRAPLDGPVYVLSRAGAAPPEVAVVLEGEGVTIEAVGQAKVTGGVESISFSSLPDVPFSELDVLLDAGPRSLLAANLPAKARGSVCGRKLEMPAQMTGQDGAVLEQTITIAVSGCARPRDRRKLHR